MKKQAPASEKLSEMLKEKLGIKEGSNFSISLEVDNAPGSYPGEYKFQLFKEEDSIIKGMVVGLNKKVDYYFKWINNKSLIDTTTGISELDRLIIEDINSMLSEI